MLENLAIAHRLNLSRLPLGYCITGVESNESCAMNSTAFECNEGEVPRCLCEEGVTGDTSNCAIRGS